MYSMIKSFHVYAWIPLFTGLIYLGGIITLLAIWEAEGRPKYQPDEGTIVYISDIGAHMKPFFISNLVPKKKLISSDLLHHGTGVCVKSGRGFISSSSQAAGAKSIQGGKNNGMVVDIFLHYRSNRTASSLCF